MLGSIRPDEHMANPHMLGADTQDLCVNVDALDAHFETDAISGREDYQPTQKIPTFIAKPS